MTAIEIAKVALREDLILTDNPESGIAVQSAIRRDQKAGNTRGPLTVVGIRYACYLRASFRCTNT
jgi:hypothetical protein